MFVCLDCGAEFETPAVSYENQGEFWGAPAYESFGACPNCGSTDYDKAKRCDRCGEWTVDGHRTIGAHLYLCECCYDDLFGREE